MTVAKSGDASPPTLAFGGEVVVFLLDEQRYALPIDRVQEIQQIVAMSDVPDDTPGLVGMINLRGEVVPALDARRLLGLPAKEYELRTPMIICRSAGSLVALVVDEVQDVADLPEGCVDSPGGVYAYADRMLGVCRLGSELIYLVDADRLLPRAPESAPEKKPRRARKKAES